MDEEVRAGEVEMLVQELMRAVGMLVPVLPVSVIAYILVSAPEETLTSSEIKARVRALTSSLESRGVWVLLRGGERDVEDGLGLLAARRLITDDEGLYRICPREIELLRYYAASISHLIETGPDAKPISHGGVMESG
jgi:glycerol-3-phosphate O-acyltransferase